MSIIKINPIIQRPDVYKRQPQSQTNTIVVPGRNSPIRYTEALGTVSYTHLDVYKRQLVIRLQISRGKVMVEKKKQEEPQRLIKLHFGMR